MNKPINKDSIVTVQVKVEDSANLLQSVFDTSLIAMSLLQAQRDKHGVIVDFIIKIVNKELERQTGRKELLGKLYRVE